MDLDDELRRLFTSDRLDVAARPDADEVIVAGARRLRTRRILTATASGAAAIVALVVAGIAMAGGNPDAMPPATTNPSTPAVTSQELTPSTSQSTTTSPSGTIVPGTTTTQRPSTNPTTTTKPPPPDLDLPVIGPNGFRALALGQTLDEAQATGMMGDGPTDSGGGCISFTLVSDGVSGQVYLSDLTVRAIVADPVMTPEGVGPGWTVEQVQEVYSVDVGPNGQALVPVLGNASASYRLQFADGVVASVGLQLDGQTCY